MPFSESLRRQIHAAKLTDTLRQLVQIPSVTGEEEAIQAEMGRRLTELGGRVDCWAVDPESLRADPGFPGARVSAIRSNVVATFPGCGGGPSLVLNGHVDTVTPGQLERWSSPPFAGVVRDGRLYGRGACDMKGGLAAILGAVGAIRRAGIRLRGSLIVQSVIGEEDGGIGSFAALARGHRGDGVIVCEPTSLAVVPAQAGVTLFRIGIPGRAAHGCVREEGESAFERFLPVHAALKALEAERNRRLRHPLYAGMDLPWPLCIGIVQAGTWPSIVPERLTCEGRIGVAIGEPLAQARGELEGAVAQAAAADPWLREHPPTVEWIGGVWEGAETPVAHPLVEALSAGVVEATGALARLGGAPYGSDLRLFINGFGIPGLLFGPGDIRLAHFTDESIPLAEVEAAALALAEAAVRFCGVAD